MATFDLIATAAFGLEAVVRRELEAGGYEAKVAQPGRVVFRGDERAIVWANLWLRASDRVLVQVGRFDAADFDALFESTKDLPWERWIGPDAAFPVSGRSIKSQLSSVPACQRAVKKAVVERLMSAHGASELPETGPTYGIEISLLDNVATLTVDSTGPALHKRGYRTLTGKAPIKETLAAAMVMLSFWEPGRALVDPFCGTGTIPIEAALIGRNIAPGINRNFTAETWPQLPGPMWRGARNEAMASIGPPLDERIIGYDVDDEALAMARHHAEEAGVDEDVHLQRQPFSELTSKRRHGVLIANPPYGMRVSDREAVEALYREMPEVFRRLETWSIYVLTARGDFENVLGQRADRRRKLYNGRIECTYYQFHGPKPGTPRPAVERAEHRAFGGISEPALRQQEEFRNRLIKMARHLRRWPKRGVTCYRLYDRDVPEVPLVIDRYEDALHVAEYPRPHERSEAEHLDWLDLMLDTAAETLEVDRDKVFFKKRGRQRGRSQYERVDEARHTKIVREGGLKFEVNLSDYVDTGLFLDHRITRSMVRDDAQDAHFLNLFAYTGAFTVYAAAGGAASTTTVDLSNTYLDWAKRNMQLNGFDIAGDRHRFVKSDAISFIDSVGGQARYDLAVVDPPTFSRSKMAPEDFDVQARHVELLNKLLWRMSDGGVIYFSTNFRRFKIDEPAIEASEVREISRQTVPDDFRNKRVHRCWRIVANG